MSFALLSACFSRSAAARASSAALRAAFAFVEARVDEADGAAWVDHGGRFPAAIARGNLAGVQFHPEKSQAAGLALLSAFLEWRP